MTDKVGIIINQVQLLLAEKRTSLAVLRTAIAVLVLPLSILGLLVATSKNYEPNQVWHLMLPLLGVCGLLFILGAYLLLRSLRRIRALDSHIEKIKRSVPEIENLTT